jgi:effector-binding domain-containing protein
MTVARTVYHGDYEGLPVAWAEFKEWIEANGHSCAVDLWERYLVGPESSDNPADWRTELNRPLA